MAETATAQTSSSPDLEKFAQPLPVPELREPDGQRNGADAYEITREESTHSFHPDLPDTTIWGFDGKYPGPLIRAERGEPAAVRFDNSGLPTEHLFEVDERVHGTTEANHPGYDKEVPVPEVRAVTHFHGLEVEPENDGQSDMWTSPEGVVGPRFVNKWQELPMEQSRLTSTYHDHTLGIVRLNAYAGLVGMYEITSQRERDLNLPTGEYDVPILLQDKTFNDDGSLFYPAEWQTSFLGDTAVVNGAVWPTMEVEPRRYRFRIVNGANHRSFGVQLRNESGGSVPTMYQFANGHAFLESVVPIGPDGDMDTLGLQVFERGEVIVDFSEHAGETFTLTNNSDLEYVPSGLSELMQIKVADPSSPPTDETADPSSLELPSIPGYDESAATTTRQMELNWDDSGELPITWLLNGYGFGDQDGIVRPKLGSTEIWEFHNPSFMDHPMHLHLVTFRVIGRGPDGTEPPDPNERGPKDTVRVPAGDTVRIITTFDEYSGFFPWHCHMLEHEDNQMMLKFEVVDDEPTNVYDNAKDPDGDGLYEDVNGDGEVNYDDVVDLFDDFEGAGVQGNSGAFDFNGNGRKDFDDIIRLFRSL